MAKFTTLYSGSSGNSALVAEGEEYLLVDMGKSCKLTTQSLYALGMSVKNLQGICITHEHYDHISGLKVFLKHTNVPVYGGVETLDYLAEHDLVQPNTELVPINGRVVEIGGFQVSAFPTSHDSVGCCGFRIATPKGKNLAIATDLGVVSEEVFAQLCNMDLVALEANYDKAMLMTGSYPYYLKTRISSTYGHLDNIDSAATLARLVREGCDKFALCHLSQENNRPQLALEAVLASFAAGQIRINEDCMVQLSKRHEVSPYIEF